MKTESSPAKIPVYVLTGFLGSGKTTLLNRLLRDGVQTAVIINEFGSTPIDQDLLEQQNMPMTVLAGGCLCCQIKGTLTPTLKNLGMAWQRAARKPFERIIIETSGVASPEPIIDSLLRERWIAQHFELIHIITTLAIPSALAHIADFHEAEAQLIWADQLLLTHDDTATPAQQTALNHYLQQHYPALAVTLARQVADLSAFSTPAFRPLAQASALEHRFNSLAWHWPKPLNWPRLQAVLHELLQDQQTPILRIKGVVALEDHASPQIVQAANGVLYPLQPFGNAQNPQSGRLIFIGTGDLQPLVQRLADAVDASVSTNALNLH